MSAVTVQHSAAEQISATAQLPTTALQVVFAGKGRIELGEQALPELGDGELLMRVALVGICATDLHLLDGEIGDPFPLVPGHEFVGEVAAIGRGAAAERGLAVGDRIVVEGLLACHTCPRCREGRYNLCDRDDEARGLPHGRQYGVNVQRTVAPGLWGGYADFLFVPENAITHRLPDGVPWEVGVLTEPLAVAFRAVRRARIQPGESVVVVGPGPVGLLTTAAARSMGAGHVTVVGTRSERLERALRFGADRVINSREQEVEKPVDARADVVIETAGVPAAQEQSVRLVRRGGRVVIAGACGGNATLTLRTDLDLLTREIDLLPSFLSAGGYEPALALLARGEFPFAELVTHRFGIDQVEHAYELIRTRADHVFKAVIDPGLGRAS